MILDLDDAIYLHSPCRTKIVTHISDAVIVGSHSLADWAKKYNKNVHLIPTGIHTSDYDKFSNTRRESNKKFTLGWIGNGPAHYENLQLLVPILMSLAKQTPDLAFRLVGALNDKKIHQLFDSIKNMRIEIIDSLNWSDPESVPRAIRDFDVGLMPLVDSEWNKGKCAFKAIEYMACSVPPVLSPVGENKFLVKDSVNGFLPDSPQEWSNNIFKLYADEELRANMGNAAHATISKWYSLKENVSLLKMILITP